MAVAVVATLLLGRWQYDVWHRHRTDSAASVTRLDPVPLDSVLGPDAAFPADGLGRPVTVQGTWDTPRTFYVANRQRAGRSGYWALTLVTTPSGSQIPVVRGWLPDLDHPPALPTGRAALVGLLQPSEDSGAPTPGTGAAKDVLGEVNITRLLPLTSHDLYGGY